MDKLGADVGWKIGQFSIHSFVQRFDPPSHIDIIAFLLCLEATRAPQNRSRCLNGLAVAERVLEAGDPV